jgi:hypothetical protein
MVRYLWIVRGKQPRDEPETTPMTTQLQTASNMMTLRVTRGKRVSEVPVATVNAASAWWCSYRDSHNLSSSRSPRVEIVVAGEVRGYVSYNGKVWEGLADNWKVGAVPVFSPA